MNLKINKTQKFNKSVKKLYKKYKNLIQDLINLEEQLQNPTNAIFLGNGLYKIRLNNSSNNKGKGSGFRVIYFFKTSDNEIYLIDIYTKNQLENINKNILLDTIKTLDP
jgi:mRNA-degrading endonuclease RelE of RelBE toxin-antitoxin system